MGISEDKQLELNELTLFQQIALEGEVASLLNNVRNEKEKLYHAFVKMALCDNKYRLLYKSEFAKYIEDESKLNEIFMCIYNEIIPTYLFVDKWSRDIRGMLGEDCGNMRIFRQPSSVVRSKLVVAFRELMGIIPLTMSALIDGIVNELDGEIDSLSTIAYILKRGNEDIQEEMENRVGFEAKVKILTTPIDQCPILNLNVEFEKSKKSAEGVSEEEVKNTITSILNRLANSVMRVDGSFGDDEDEDDFEDEEDQLVYIVKKIDKSNNNVVQEKTFDSKEEATKWINEVVKDYPELTKRFNFVVELSEAD